MFAGIKRFCREIDQPNSIFFDRLELPRFDTHSNVITVEVPPLRERREDIPLFIGQFLNTWTERSGKVVEGVSESVLADLLQYE